MASWGPEALFRIQLSAAFGDLFGNLETMAVVL